jgi:hypothetical protein
MKISGRSDRIIKPGTSDAITVSANTSSISTGRLSRKLRVTTNDPQNRSTTLTCNAKVLMPFKVSPRSANFGQILRSEEQVKRTLTITRGDGGPIKPAVSNVKPNVHTEIREIEPGEKYELDIALTPPWPNGRLREYLTLQTGISQKPDTRIVVYGNVAPRVVARPGQIIVQSPLETALKQTVRLQWTDKSEHRILGAEAGDPNLHVQVVEENEQQYVLVEAAAGYQPASRGARPLVIRTDDQEMPEVKVPIRVRRASARAPRQPSRVRPPRNVTARSVRPPVKAERPKPPTTATKQPAEKPSTEQSAEKPAPPKAPE